MGVCVMRYLELNKNNIVINIIIWDGISPYTTEGHLLLADENPGVSFGWKLENNEWIAPEEKIEPESESETE